MAESNDPMEGQPNIGTPKHPRDLNFGPLEDTPPNPKSGTAANQTKRLKKKAFSQGKGTRNLSKEEAFLNCPKKKGKGR
jgi:hypothetical protein